MRSFSRYATSSPLRPHPSASSSTIHGHRGDGVKVAVGWIAANSLRAYTNKTNHRCHPYPRSMLRLTLRLDAPLELSSMLRSGLTLLMCLCSCLIVFYRTYTLRVHVSLHGRATSFVVLHPNYTLMRSLTLL
ncbi:uncharacterized protein SCHCODRAFT_02638232 [Schizophyllum commune H4-8]|uniref:uncharacterized protein n=1 Tax=Schizophyllum commune (strain H4-8 / FGSC 9210) TaxID=578458 RepID=UPI0021600BD0|nr:uncharacterized protein SCHCODRAFT_02638232 [Schizophyllum commune H4-8]KAI5887480.1 hypothetical protein SCHCODRAFT_02638232 [Schizophyllum commune H4-8]